MASKHAANGLDNVPYIQSIKPCYFKDRRLVYIEMLKMMMMTIMMMMKSTDR